MPNDGLLELTWGDGEHTFALTIPLIRELEEKTGSGPLAIMSRLSDGTWKVDDVRETIRLDLIGGGKTPVEALKLVQGYLDSRPIAENLPAAIAIIGHALFGRRLAEVEG
ncbi:MAG: gene transfer agent family protein [Methylacidiphilales bacterium]|nr:gene transfer agent family protein [Candidatus Methylacidiphilales bacterium]